MANRLHPLVKRTRADIQQCKDCKGNASMPNPARPTRLMDCPTCNGQGIIPHRAPYRLADGTWSDGVDRTAWLRDWAYGRLNPNRVTVGCWSYGTDKDGREVREGFVVYRGNSRLMNGDAETFPTFAEAIRYADHHARTTKNGEKP